MADTISNIPTQDTQQQLYLSSDITDSMWQHVTACDSGSEMLFVPAAVSISGGLFV